MRSFNSFTFDVVEKLFHLTEIENSSSLNEWLKTEYSDNEHIYYQLDSLKNHLLKKAHIWNEDELKMFFIGPLIEAAKLETENFQPFTQRAFSIELNAEIIGGRVDFILAKGRRVPEQPYLCVHEYKQETDKEGDPLGQVLVAMAVAQKLNEEDLPIFGAYVIGRLWFFVLLEGKNYAKSAAYDASTEDIFQIFAILQKSKDLITAAIQKN